MGVRKGQGYGYPKPKHAHCPACGKKGVTGGKPIQGDIVRGCRYCQASWGSSGWAAVNGKKTHITHPYKIELAAAWPFGACHGRAMFEKREDAEKFSGPDGPPVKSSRPGDTEFA